MEEEKQFHLINEEKVIQLNLNYHNETVIFLKEKEDKSVHILKTERSSFPKERDLLPTENEILQFVQQSNGLFEKEIQFDVILLSETVLKSHIDYIKEIVNYSNIYLFEYGDIFYPTQTMHMKDKIEIIYQVKPSILQISGYQSQHTGRKTYHVFYDGLWKEVPESFFE
mgnify:FL=1